MSWPKNVSQQWKSKRFYKYSKRKKHNQGENRDRHNPKWSSMCGVAGVE